MKSDTTMAALALDCLIRDESSAMFIPPRLNRSVPGSTVQRSRTKERTLLEVRREVVIRIDGIKVPSVTEPITRFASTLGLLLEKPLEFQALPPSQLERLPRILQSLSREMS